MPATGGKMLNHAKVDLSKASVFSSRTDQLWPSEEAVVAASYAEAPSQFADIATTVNEGTWAIAQPGKPANLPTEADQPGGGWKASSEVIPAVATMPAAPKHVERTAAPQSNAKKPPAAAVAKKPAWSAERQGSSSKSARPRWSATR
jgi:hypothetical protein